MTPAICKLEFIRLNFRFSSMKEKNICHVQ